MSDQELCALGTLTIGEAGTVGHLDAARVGKPGLEPDELERRLLEIGFVEGAAVRVLHQGLIGGDPIAVLVNECRVAIRRNEASAVMVRKLV